MQQSSRITSCRGAQGLALLPMGGEARAGEVKAGEVVEVLLLD